MPELAREIDRSVCDAVLEETGQDISALLVHAKNAYGVPMILPKDIVPPSELSERLGCLVWAFSLLRCQVCGALSDSGRFCSNHAATPDVEQVRGGLTERTDQP